MRWLAAASIVALMVTTGCKKDKPAKTEAAGATQTESTSPGTPADNSSDKTKNTLAGSPPSAGATTANKTRTARVINDVKLPADVIAVIGTAGIDTLWRHVQSKAGKFGVPLPITKAGALAQVQQFVGFSNMKWLATDKPLLIVAWNPKKSSEGMLLLPITSAEAFKAALPANATKSDDGKTVTLDVLGKSAYTNVVGSYLAVSMSKTLYPDAADFLRGFASKWTPTGLIEAKVSATNLKSIFEAELNQLMGQADTLKAMMAKELAQETPIPGLDKILDFYIAMLKVAVDETETLGFHADLGDKGTASFTASIAAKRGGKIAAFAKTMAAADLSFAKNIPTSAWAVGATHIDPKVFAGMTGWTVDMMSGILGLTAEEKTKLTTQIDQLLKMATGKSWFAMYSDGGIPFAMATSTQVSDGATYSKIMSDYLSFIATKALALVKEHLPPELKTVPTDDFSKFISTLNGVTSVLAGVTLKATTVSANNVTTHSLSVTVDMEKIKALGGEAELLPIIALFGNKVEAAVSYGPKAMAVAIGPNATKTSADAAAGKGGGTRDITLGIPAGTAMIVHIDIAKTVRAMEPIAKLIGEDASKWPKVPDGSFVAMTLGGSGNTVTAGVTLSLDDLIKLGIQATQQKRAAPIAVPAPPATPKPEKKEAPATKKKAAPGRTR